MQKLSQSRSERNRRPAAIAALGSLPKDRPSAPGAASSPSNPSEIVEIIDKTTGEIHGYNSADDVRLMRYVRQSAARRLLPGNRVSWCLRRPGDNERPSVLLDQQSGCAHFGGLISCGRVWECPVCAAKISQRRRDELSNALDQHRAGDGGLLLVTFTYAHTWADDVAELLVKQQKAWDAVKASRAYKELKAAHGLTGTVRALEITHGVNGWHPHIHEIWFMESPVYSSVTMAAIKTRLFQLWRVQCLKKGLGEPSEQHGIDVRNGSFVSTYVSKWGLEDELTKANAKKARRPGSRSPFQLLDDYIDGDKQAGALFIEYAKAFKGKRQLCWSKGLKRRFAMADKTDEEIAAEQPNTADVLGVLDLDQWRLVLKFRGARRDCRAELLAHAQRGRSWSAVLEYLQSLSPLPVSQKRRARSVVSSP